MRLTGRELTRRRWDYSTGAGWRNGGARLITRFPAFPRREGRNNCDSSRRIASNAIARNPQAKYIVLACPESVCYLVLVSKN